MFCYCFYIRFCAQLLRMIQKLTKANKSLHVLRKLRREGYSEKEIGYLFNSIVTIVLPNISYGLAVYGAAKAELTTIQGFFR